MSADLLAEFGSGSASKPSQKTPSQSQQQFETSSLIPDLDVFGDSTAHPVSGDSKPAHHGSVGGPGHQTIQPHISSPSLSESIWRHDDSGADVLFDAATEDAPAYDDDDWGEFETPESAPRNQEDIVAPKVTSTSKVTSTPKVASTAKVAVQSVSAGSNSTTKGVPATSGFADLMARLSIGNKGSSVETRQPSASIKSEIPASINRPNPQRKAPSALQTPIAEDQQGSFDEWGDFVDADDGERSIQEQRPNTQVKNQHSNKQSSRDKPKPSLPSATTFKSAGSPQTSEASQSQVRPTNIPPPSVLLQLFPPLFERLQEDAAAAKKDAGNSAFSLYLVLNLACTLRVASRIIVGRTLRWKRDFILSQSTKIGPARSGKQGGMKLSTVSKSENVKEEQEAVEVLDAWRRRAALFNSLMISCGERPIPVIAVHAPVGTVKGALKAPHACFLCGLKRDERLPKIDDNAQDSFGEWWVEYWGHTDCKQFWEEHSKSLHQR